MAKSHERIDRRRLKWKIKTKKEWKVYEIIAMYNGSYNGNK